MNWHEDVPDDPASVAWRVGVDYYGDDFVANLDGLLDVIGRDDLTALIVQDWGEPNMEPFPVDVLIECADWLRGLRALFIGELSSEQCEISWIRQGDLTPLLEAFPRLERLWVRGSAGLAFTPLRHESLRELVIQSGGLPAAVIHQVTACDLPALRELELWLGVPHYGGDAGIADLEPILSGRAFPALERLGLRNAEFTDEIAAAIAGAPIVAGLRELDLSLGTLGDDGAEALLSGQPLTHLKRLDLHHHYMALDMAQWVADELPGVSVDVSEAFVDRPEGRYTAVGE